MKTSAPPFSFATDLCCPLCNQLYDMHAVQSYATCCQQPLLTTYNSAALFPKRLLTNRSHSIWRYHEMLPVSAPSAIISLGEGWTPIHDLHKIARALPVNRVLLKDESTNPTNSFKARGISVAISKAKEAGITHCIIPTAGNAGIALSAYAAKAGMKATVVMPNHTAGSLKEACRLYGAELVLIDGLIDACGRTVKKMVAETGAFDMSTLREPYRLEGKKTLGYEIAEQLNWKLPDLIIYPTGGGTGLIGMWKAFHEMLQLGWIHPPLPRMIIVQSENCNPMIQVCESGSIAENYVASPSGAYGLAVPLPFAKDMIRNVVKESGGAAVSVSESEMTEGIGEMAKTEGLLLSPEGSATYTGLKKLIEKDYVKENETVLLFNTGSWFTYR